MATSSNYPNMQQPQRDPNMALMMSIIPGLGQFYNGESRKGLLFLCAGVINFITFLCILFNGPILSALDSFGRNFNIAPNQQLIHSMGEMGIGSPASLVLLGLFISFIAFSMRDAFEHAAHRRRKSLYADVILEMPEATSGSYLLHVSCMIAFLILAFFFLIPPPPRVQITDIEFIQNQEEVKKKVKSRRKAEHNSKDAGKRDPTKRPTPPSPAPKSASKPAPKAQPKPQQPAKAPSPTPKSSPSPRPTPRPTPTPSRTPSPSPTPRPTPTPSPTRAPSPSPAPKAAPTPFNIPNPFAKAPASPRSAPSPVPAPVSVGNVGAPSVPAPRIASASGAAQGGPAPAPIASIKTGSSGGGGSRSPVPIMAGGGSSGSKHGGGSPGPAPAPSKAGSGSGGGSSGPSLAVAPSVPAPRGGGSGQGVQGNPEKDGEGRPSLAAEKDIDFGPYMADLQRRIKRAWFPPKGNESKRVMVVFKVHRNGTMSNLRLARSSGLAIADQAALKAVTNAAPFRPLPAGAPEDVDIQFTFDYNVFKSGRSAGTFRRF